MSERFRAMDRDTAYLLPPSVQDWLPEQHLARFVVEVASKLDLHELEMPYAGRGSKAFTLGTCDRTGTATEGSGRTGRTARTSWRAAGRQRLLQRSQREGLRGCGRGPLHCHGTGAPSPSGRTAMDAGQHGLESEAALQSLPTALIADRRPGSQIPSPVENTPLRTPAQAWKCRITAILGASSPNRPAKVQSSIRRRSMDAFKSDRLLDIGDSK